MKSNSYKNIIGNQLYRIDHRAEEVMRLYNLRVMCRQSRGINK